MYRALDCQGFAGGFTLGMVQAGFTLVGKREMKGGFGAANCEANRHLLGDSWRTEARDPEHWTPAPADVVFGNPPCSGFSVMSAREFRGADSKINHCMWAFVDFAARVRPTIAVFESVGNAYTSESGQDLMRRLRLRLEESTGEAWGLYHVRHNAIAVGGAAVRRRYFWLASRVRFGVERPGLTKFPVLDDVIGDLANLPQTWQAQPYRSPASWWARPRRSSSGAVDGHQGLDNPLTRRIRDLLAGIDWEPGMAIGQAASKYWDTYGKLPDSWQSIEEKTVKNEFNMGFTTPTRWHGDRYGRVVTGGGLHNIIHPRLDRTVTHREVARILGFPDDWRILPLRRVTGLNMTWGKGITVDCGRWIGGWIRAALDGNPGSYTGKQLADDEFDIDVTNDYLKLGSPDIVTREIVFVPVPRREPRMTEATPAAETGTEAASRGRPRPDETIQRDEQVLKHLTSAGPQTRSQIVAALGLDGKLVYLSLYRLNRGGQISRTGGTWSVVAEAAAA